MSEAQLHPGSELLGDEMTYTRVIRKPTGTPGLPAADGEDGEFTVKLLKVRIHGLCRISGRSQETFKT